MNGFDLSTIQGLYYGATECSAIYKGSSLIWQSGPEPYKDQYLTFESLEDNNEIGFKKYSNSTSPRDIEYSTDKVNWTVVASSYSGSSGTILATLNTGDKLYLKGTNAAYDSYVNSTHEYNCFTSTKTFNVYGNIMSLINGSTFKTLTSFSSNNVFRSLFTGAKIVDASNLILPVMSLTITCYGDMFNGCTSLTTAPELPATTLNNNCYRQMFYGCSKLNYVKMLATDISATNCLYRWLNNVSASGTFIKDASMTSLPSGSSGIPSGWTVQDAT